MALLAAPELLGATEGAMNGATPGFDEHILLVGWLNISLEN